VRGPSQQTAPQVLRMYSNVRSDSETTSRIPGSGQPACFKRVCGIRYLPSHPCGSFTPATPRAAYRRKTLRNAHSEVCSNGNAVGAPECHTVPFCLFRLACCYQLVEPWLATWQQLATGWQPLCFRAWALWLRRRTLYPLTACVPLVSPRGCLFPSLLLILSSLRAHPPRAP
jgi:hypothetical protein